MKISSSKITVSDKNPLQNQQLNLEKKVPHDQETISTNNYSKTHYSLANKSILQNKELNSVLNTEYKDSSMVQYEITFAFQELDPLYNNDYTDLDQDTDGSLGY